METAVLVLDILMTIACLVPFIWFIKDCKIHKEDFKRELRVGGWKKTAKVSFFAILFLFFDVLGIGSYGPHTSCWKIFKVTRDVYIPGTLSTCMLTATAVESVYLVTNVDVEIVTLVAAIIASTIGAYLGGGVVSHLNTDKIRIAMGIAFIVIAIILILGLAGVLDIAGGEDTGLSGWKLILFVIISFFLGALMTLGIGNYAPTLALVSLLGMNPLVSYPIMLGSCAFLIPAAAIRFCQESIKSSKPKYDRKIVVVENIVGPIGPLIAMTLLISMDVSTLKILVVCVLLIAAAMMLYQYYTKAEDKVALAEDAEMEGIV